MFEEILKAILFGIVEGITEWLPISSTGHLMLLDELVPLDVSAGFYDTFLVVIQLGAILAVIVLYFHKLNPFSSRKTSAEKRETWGIWAKVVVGSIPAAIVGLTLDKWVETHIMNSEHLASTVVAIALIGYGIVFIVIEQYRKRKLRRLTSERYALAASQQAETFASNATPPATSQGFHGKHARIVAIATDPNANERTDDPESSERDLSSAISSVNSFQELGYGRAFIIGIFQSLAVIPGTSRSGSIIIGSLLVGTSRTIATEFAFFLAIPIMLGWSLLKFLRHGLAYTTTEWVIFAVGILTAFLVSIVAIKFLIGYIKRNDFTAFGVYRIVIGVVVLLFFGLLVS